MLRSGDKDPRRITKTTRWMTIFGLACSMRARRSLGVIIGDDEYANDMHNRLVCVAVHCVTHTPPQPTGAAFVFAAPTVIVETLWFFTLQVALGRNRRAMECGAGSGAPWTSMSRAVNCRMFPIIGCYRASP